MTQLKLYGRAVDHDVDLGLLTLSEVTFVASPVVLRAVAHFLMKSANDLEEWGDRFGHNHLRDEWPEWEIGFGDVIVSTTYAQSR